VKRSGYAHNPRGSDEQNNAEYVLYARQEDAKQSAEFGWLLLKKLCHFCIKKNEQKLKFYFMAKFLLTLGLALTFGGCDALLLSLSGGGITLLKLRILLMNFASGFCWSSFNIKYFFILISSV
jgi:hypothetical protein